MLNEARFQPSFTFDIHFALRLIAFNFTSELGAIVFLCVLDLEDAAVLSPRDFVLARRILQQINAVVEKRGRGECKRRTPKRFGAPRSQISDGNAQCRHRPSEKLQQMQRQYTFKQISYDKKTRHIYNSNLSAKQTK